MYAPKNKPTLADVCEKFTPAELAQLRELNATIIEIPTTKRYLPGWLLDREVAVEIEADGIKRIGTGAAPIDWKEAMEKNAEIMEIEEDIRRENLVDLVAN